MTDLCDTCTEFRDRGQYEALALHVEKVSIQRNYIRQLKSTFEQNDEACIECDYSEKFRLPLFVFQPKQFHFKTGVGVEVFGIVNSRSKKQTNILALEGRWPGHKGIESVGSYWFYYLRFAKNKMFITKPLRSYTYIIL
jgi:hypothetical protein